MATETLRRYTQDGELRETLTKYTRYPIETVASRIIVKLGPERAREIFDEVINEIPDPRLKDFEEEYAASIYLLAVMLFGKKARKIETNKPITLRENDRILVAKFSEASTHIMQDDMPAAKDKIQEIVRLKRVVSETDTNLNGFSQEVFTIISSSADFIREVILSREENSFGKNPKRRDFLAARMGDLSSSLTLGDRDLVAVAVANLTEEIEKSEKWPSRNPIVRLWEKSPLY